MKILLIVLFCLYASLSFGQDGQAIDMRLEGAIGATGPTGQNGLDGAPGAPGSNGINGSDGATGPTGATGAIGPTGVQAPTDGLESFFLQPRGSFGTGAGWSDEGFIGDVPVLLFAANATERAIYSFYALSRVILTDTNPRIAFIVYSTIVPVITTGDSVVWQLEARYIAETELATKAVDETILFTQGLPTLMANTRQTILEFTLNRTLMTDQDVLLFTLSRIGGDGSDLYSADIAIGQSGIIVLTLNHNP